jgi:hypothetical protein
MRFCKGAPDVVAVVGLGWLVGCSGTVQPEPDGDGGAAAGGAAAGGAAAESGPGSGGNASSMTSLSDACTDFCATWETCLGTTSCLADCEAELSEACISQQVAVLVCVTDIFNGNCNYTTPPCPQEYEALDACIQASTCQQDGCGQDDTSCVCQGVCFNAPLEQECFFDASGQIPCDCYQDGVLIGTCTVSGNACSIDDGCCKGLL